MQLKTFTLAILFFALFASAVWIYKGQELQENQILVYITGATISEDTTTPAPAIPTIPTSTTSSSTTGLCKAGAIGDSITSGGGYIAQLNARCAANLFDNHGIGGQGTGAMVSRFDADIISHNYRDVIILAGVNDIASSRSVNTIKNNLAEMYNRAKNAGMHVIAVTITPWQDHSSWTPKFQAKTEEVNRWILSKPENVDVTVDAYSVLNAFSTKPLHPNNAGQKAIGDAIYNAAYSNGQCKQLKCNS
ncbi:MAG: GDSL-type esterase/lipase family protein [Candidatus Micrarchaeota archaeon]